VVRHLLARGIFKVRAMTRDVRSPKAAALRACDCEVVYGSLDDTDSIKAACQNCIGVFAIQMGSPLTDVTGKGVAQGKRLVDACRDAGVRHLVYSSLDDLSSFLESGGADGTANGLERPSPESGHTGETRAAVEKYAISCGVPITVVYPSFFYENFLEDSYWKHLPDGRLVLSLPMSNHQPFFLFAVEDLGGIVCRVFERPELYIGKSIGAAADYLSGPQLARVFMAVTGKAVCYEEVPAASLTSSADKYLLQKAQLCRFFEERAVNRDISACRQIFPQLMSWRKWLRKSAFKGPLEGRSRD